MSWWTDVRDQTLNNLGIDTGQNAANTAGAAVMDLLKSPAAEPPAEAGEVADGVAPVRRASVFGLSIPLAIAGAAAVYFLFLRKR